MARAMWKDTVIAESDDTVMVEGNHYFPAESVKWEYFSGNDKQTTCPWKGVASYFDVIVDGEVNAAAAWQYSEPKTAAANIKDHVAFWGGVEVKAGA